MKIKELNLTDYGEGEYNEFMRDYFNLGNSCEQTVADVSLEKMHDAMIRESADESVLKYGFAGHQLWSQVVIPFAIVSLAGFVWVFLRLISTRAVPVWKAYAKVSESVSWRTNALTKNLDAQVITRSPSVSPHQM